MPGLLPVIAIEGETLVTEALWIDQYGNVQLNVGPDDLQQWGDPFTLILGDRRETIHRRSAYRHINTGEVGAVIDSQGLISLAINGGSAAAQLELATGTEIRICSAEMGDALASGQTVAVTLEPRRGTE